MSRQICLLKLFLQKPGAWANPLRVSAVWVFTFFFFLKDLRTSESTRALTVLFNHLCFTDDFPFKTQINYFNGRKLVIVLLWKPCLKAWLFCLPVNASTKVFCRLLWACSACGLSRQDESQLKSKSCVILLAWCTRYPLPLRWVP